MEDHELVLKAFKALGIGDPEKIDMVLAGIVQPELKSTAVGDYMVRDELHRRDRTVLFKLNEEIITAYVNMSDVEHAQHYRKDRVHETYVRALSQAIAMALLDRCGRSI